MLTITSCDVAFCLFLTDFCVIEICLSSVEEFCHSLDVLNGPFQGPLSQPLLLGFKWLELFLKLISSSSKTCRGTCWFMWLAHEMVIIEKNSSAVLFSLCMSRKPYTLNITIILILFKLVALESYNVKTWVDICYRLNQLNDLSLCSTPKDLQSIQTCTLGLY